MKLALRHFYKGNADAVEVSKRTLTEGAALVDLRETFGQGGLISLVYLLIERFNSLYNFAPSKKMTANQIEDLAAELVLDFLEQNRSFPVTLEELAVFFDRAGRNEFTNPKNGRSFIFDRIDKSVVLEMLDFYFEDQKKGRTAAAWLILDQAEKDKREAANEAHTPRMKVEDQPFDINTFIQGRSHLTAKGLKEIHEKYGGENGKS